MSSSEQPITTARGVEYGVERIEPEYRTLGDVLLRTRLTPFGLQDYLTVKEARDLGAQLMAAALQAETEATGVRPSAETQMQQGCEESLAQASIVNGALADVAELDQEIADMQVRS